MDQQNNRGKRYTRTEHVVASTFDVSYNKQGHHARELKCVQMPKREIRVGQWKQLYPPEDHGKNHITASCRRSFYFAKYKTPSLQIYGNNVTGAKGCHFKSTKAHFTVVLMASHVKANYTPTCWEREIKVGRGMFHRSWERQHSFQAMLINHRLKQSIGFLPLRKGKHWWQGSPKGDLGSSSKGQDSTLATCWNDVYGCGWEVGRGNGPT